MAEPHGARWCDSHSRLECAKNRKHGQGPCHAPAIRGTANCRLHGGVSTVMARIQGEARITAWTAIGAPPDKAPLNSGEAVLAVLQMTWIRLNVYSELLRRQAVAQGMEADDTSEKSQPEASGLIGYRYGAAGKDGIVYVQSEEIRALVALESAERDRVVKYAKTAHDMGISERLTNLAGRWGDMVVTRILTMLEELELSPEQQAQVPRLVRSHLGTIDVDA